MNCILCGRPTTGHLESGPRHDRALTAHCPSCGRYHLPGAARQVAALATERKRRAVADTVAAWRALHPHQQLILRATAFL